MDVQQALVDLFPELGMKKVNFNSEGIHFHYLESYLCLPVFSVLETSFK